MHFTHLICLFLILKLNKNKTRNFFNNISTSMLSKNINNVLISNKVLNTILNSLEYNQYLIHYKIFEKLISNLLF